MTIDRGANTPAGVMGVECLVTAYTYKTNDEDSIVTKSTDNLAETLKNAIELYKLRQMEQ